MTKFHDIPFFFLLTLKNNQPNNINTGKGLSKMNFSRMKMLKLTRRGAGLSSIFQHFHVGENSFSLT